MKLTRGQGQSCNLYQAWTRLIFTRSKCPCSDSVLSAYKPYVSPRSKASRLMNTWMISAACFKVFFGTPDFYDFCYIYAHWSYVPSTKRECLEKTPFLLEKPSTFWGFLVVIKKKTFFVSKNSKFRLRYHHRNVFTYLCVKYHVS